MHRTSKKSAIGRKHQCTFPRSFNNLSINLSGSKKRKNASREANFLFGKFKNISLPQMCQAQQ